MGPEDNRQDLLVRGTQCPLRWQNKWGDLKYLFMMTGGSTKQIEVTFAALKMIRLVKSRDEREASEGSAKAN